MKRYIKRFCTLLLLFCLLLSSVPVSAAERIYAGFDVSRWQGEIDFNEAARAGYEVVYIRAGDGTEPDSMLDENYRKARGAGLHIGFYFYVTAETVEEAGRQAEYFASLIRKKRYDCRPAMDFEAFGSLDRSEINAIATEFLNTLEQLTGYRPVLYTDSYAAARIWDDSLSRYPLWVAAYDGGQTPDTGSWKEWSGYQYSDSGRVAGISTRVDLDYFHSSLFLTEPEKDKNRQPPAASYTVRAGNTLWGIARRFHVTVRELARINRLKDPNRIYPGEKLLLPDSDRTGRTERMVLYRVMPGDTLYSLARRFGTSVALIAVRNHLENPNRIYVGEELWIPLP